MRVEGVKELSAPRDVVWQVLNDPAQMAKLMPGVEGFEVRDDRHWQAKVKIPLGLGGLRMTIDFDKVEERPPEFAQLNAKGNGVGAIMNMQTQFNLAENGTGTTMRWEADGTWPEREMRVRSDAASAVEWIVHAHPGWVQATGAASELAPLDLSVIPGWQAAWDLGPATDAILNLRHQVSPAERHAIGGVEPIVPR